MLRIVFGILIVVGIVLTVFFKKLAYSVSDFDVIWRDDDYE